MNLAMCGVSNLHWGPMASLFERETPWFTIAFGPIGS